jgi:hypothetical protein
VCDRAVGVLWGGIGALLTTNLSARDGYGTEVCATALFDRKRKKCK